jgi:D-glycerate 3-kinase
MTKLRESFKSFLLNENLPVDAMLQNFSTVYLPLAKWINQQHESGSHIIGVNGAQGSGKSTLCKLLAMLLQQAYGKTVVTLSLDDFYLTLAQRKALALQIHPLLQTRGVPGTHDVALAISVLTALGNGDPVSLPRFDKALDDRIAASEWQTISQPIDIVLFEGWCVGALPQTPEQLQNPVNALEATEDVQGIWRQYVNARLADDYQKLFDLLDVLVMLKVPAFEKIYAWRTLQESSLLQGMNAVQLRRFIMHYQRLTVDMLAEMPQRANLVLQIGDNHQIVSGI